MEINIDIYQDLLEMFSLEIIQIQSVLIILLLENLLQISEITIY
nr:MAG TPA: hypothetical protein [Caudoviricetes sp.]